MQAQTRPTPGLKVASISTFASSQHAALRRGVFSPDCDYNDPKLAMTPAAPKYANKVARMNQFEGVLTMSEANGLAVLDSYEMVLIADDSGSMNSLATPPHMRSLGQPSASFWDELRHTVSEVVEMATCLDESGVDVVFLNRVRVVGIKSGSDASLLVGGRLRAPSCPQRQTLQRFVFRIGGKSPILLFIFMDGAPHGGPMPRKQAISLRVQIIACTGDDEIGWINVLDRELFDVDVTGGYHTESRRELHTSSPAMEAVRRAKLLRSCTTMTTRTNEAGARSAG